MSRGKIRCVLFPQFFILCQPFFPRSGSSVINGCDYLGRLWVTWFDYFFLFHLKFSSVDQLSYFSSVSLDALGRAIKRRLSIFHFIGIFSFLFLLSFFMFLPVRFLFSRNFLQKNQRRQNLRRKRRRNFYQIFLADTLALGFQQEFLVNKKENFT